MEKRLRHILRRVGFSFFTLLAVLVFNFFLFRILPGDPVQMIVNPRMRPETLQLIRSDFGLDKPIWLNLQEARSTGKVGDILDSQFFLYFKNLIKGELGDSFHFRQPVAEVIGERLGPTILLVVTGEIAGIVLGSIMGLLTAWKKKSAIDASLMTLGLCAWALPPFWLGIILLLLARGHLPMGGMMTTGVAYAGLAEKVLDIAKHLVLPASTLAILLFGSYLLIVRNTTLEVLAEDYILTAKAKGLGPLRVLKDHALKNASLPLVTLIALDLGSALGGAIQVETVFSWPGIGRLMFDAIGQRDYPVLQGVFLVLALGVIIANLLADLTYVVLDPRVQD